MIVSVRLGKEYVEDLSMSYVKRLKNIFSKFNFPYLLSSELDNFVVRNNIPIEQKNGLGEVHVCSRCLKAHLLTLSVEKHIDKIYFKALERIFPCPAGHDGHYLDGEKVRTLPFPVGA